jgi:hypothetical protein
MPRKKSKEELARAEQAVKVELLHLLRMVARDRKTSSALRLRACDRIAAIIGVLSPDIVDKYVRKRLTLEELRKKTVEEPEVESLDQEKAEIAAWLNEKKEEQCPSNLALTDPRSTDSSAFTTAAGSTSSSMRPLETQ